jgi:hypothetical protein
MNKSHDWPTLGSRKLHYSRSTNVSIAHKKKKSMFLPFISMAFYYSIEFKPIIFIHNDHILPLK